VAVLGFTTGSAVLILTAAALTLPASIVALPAYYVAYGLLALVPGANPDSAAGSACSDPGACPTVSTGDLAPWFAGVTLVLGILLLVAAAVADVMLARAVRAGRRTDLPVVTSPGQR
jgi:hypothetical protein